MTTAGGLALAIIGAILKYAVTWEPTWVDLGALGTILIWGGLLGVLLGLLRSWARARAERRLADTAHTSARYAQEPPGYEQPGDEPARHDARDHPW